MVNDMKTPVCDECGSKANECDCWDYKENAHLILAYRFYYGLIDGDIINSGIDWDTEAYNPSDNGDEDDD